MRFERDRLLLRIVSDVIRDDTELFKQFMDNDDFKRWMTGVVFELAYDQAGQASPPALQP